MSLSPHLRFFARLPAAGRPRRAQNDKASVCVQGSLEVADAPKPLWRRREGRSLLRQRRGPRACRNALEWFPVAGATGLNCAEWGGVLPKPGVFGSSYSVRKRCSAPAIAGVHRRFYFRRAYSARACLSAARPGSASFHSSRNRSYSFFAAAESPVSASSRASSRT